MKQNFKLLLHHLPNLYLMFILKFLKLQNLMCKKDTNQQHANSAIIIIMFIKAC